MGSWCWCCVKQGATAHTNIKDLVRVLSTRQRGTCNGYFSTDDKHESPAPAVALPPLLHTLRGREYNTPSLCEEFATITIMLCRQRSITRSGSNSVGGKSFATHARHLFWDG